MDTLPFALPDIGNAEIEAVTECLRSGWLTSGVKVREFEAQFSRMTGAKHAIAVSSATVAALLIFDSLGLDSPSEVIVPAYTFSGPAMMAHRLGAKIVLADTIPGTYQINPDHVEQLITPFTRVVMPTHFAGQACDMRRLKQICDANRVHLIDDAAHAFPAFDRSTQNVVGSGFDSTATFFSFYATKTVTTGEGGMITTRDDALAERIRSLRLHGFNRELFDRYTNPKTSWRYEITAPGWKANMTDISAAMGIAQLTLYVKRCLLNGDDLIGWARTQGFKFVQAPQDLHVTIAYSKTPFDWRELRPEKDDFKTINDEREVAQFGDATVLTFKSPELEDRWQQFRDAGASWSHDGFNPHVTISWQFEGDVSKVEPYRGPLIFGPEIFDTINDDWKAEHSELPIRKAELSLADRLNDVVLNGGKLQIDIGANLTTSRLVSLGFLAEAVKTGATEYQVNEVLDARTCPVCRYMHGKTFKVQNEHDRLIQTLSTSDPQELKALAPWPRQRKQDLQELYGLSADEMQARGWGSPPYHPGCRGMLNMTGLVDEDVPLGGGDLATPDTGGLQIADFKILGVTEPAGPAAAVVANGWTADAIDQLGWDRFQITDPDTFVHADQAFDAKNYDLVEQILTDWIAINS